MTRPGATHRWLRRLLAALVVGAPAIVVAQSSANADLALRQIDDHQCEAAVETINQGMRDQEPKAYFVAGQLFQHGFCLVTNGPRAARLYERGALLGDRDCARALALMHARGDGVPQSYPQAGRWYAVMRDEKAGSAAPSPESFAQPEALVKTYVDAVNDLAVVGMNYPREAIEQGVTGSVRVRFDPRFARVTLLGSTDNVGQARTDGPDRHDFERALLAGYADAIRVLPKPAMSPNVDNSVEHRVVFDRKAPIAGQPPGLQALAR